MSNKAIYFDMDGTLADLYGVEGWLEKLGAFDPTPYRDAPVLLNMQALAHRLNRLQRLGYTIGVISWASKGDHAAYDAEVAEVKIEWLRKHLGSVKWDEIHITTFGKKKHKTAKVKGGYLFDDNENVRREWIKNNPEGWAFDVTDILGTLDLFN